MRGQPSSESHPGTEAMESWSSTTTSGSADSAFRSGRRWGVIVVALSTRYDRSRSTPSGVRCCSRNPLKSGSRPPAMSAAPYGLSATDHPAVRVHPHPLAPGHHLELQVPWRGCSARHPRAAARRTRPQHRRVVRSRPAPPAARAPAPPPQRRRWRALQRRCGVPGQQRRDGRQHHGDNAAVAPPAAAGASLRLLDDGVVDVAPAPDPQPGVERSGSSVAPSSMMLLS